MSDRATFPRVDAYILLADGLDANGVIIRETEWPFASGMHFGRHRLWWLVEDEHEHWYETFCEAWQAAVDEGFVECEAASHA